MAINLESTGAAGAASPGRLDRHDAQARQDRWTLELERAMLSSQAKKSRDNGPAAERTMPADRQQPAMPGMTQAAAHAKDTGGAPLKDAFEQLHGAEHGAQRTGDAGVAATEAVSEHKPDAAPGDQAAVAAPAAAGALSHPHGLAPLHAAPAPQAGIASLDSAASAASPSAAIAAKAGAPGAATAQANAAPPAAVRIAAAAGRMPAPALAADVHTAQTSPAEAAPAAEATSAQLGEMPEFDKRLMHLYVDGDGVHAFIRDAELGAAQMRAVAQAMAAQLAASGQTLAALTVNGKAVDPRPALSGGDSPAFIFEGGERDAPAPFAHLHSLVRKGNF